MWQTFRQPGIAGIGAFLFLWSFNPFSSTVLYYYSIQALHFSEQFVGTLTSWNAVGLLTGSIVYGVICRLIPLPRLIHGSILAGILSTIAYWGYRDTASGVIISLVVGIVYAIGSLIQLDLAARVCRSPTWAPRFRRVSADRSTTPWSSAGDTRRLFRFWSGWAHCSPRGAGC
jgi:Na+/melibiose symporter-like transporter